MAKVKSLFKIGLNKILPGNQPDFLIIGAQKSATTSLHYYLSQHDYITAGKAKEIDFFSKDINFRKGESWYKSHFKKLKTKDTLFFEASPSYLYRSFAPERINNFKKNIKLIAILRNPVDRSFSAWNMYRDIFDLNRIPERFSVGYDGKENYLFNLLYKDRKTFPSFEECLEIEMDLIKNACEMEEPSIIRRSIYFDQLNRYYKYFKKEQLLIMEFDELLSSKVDVLNKICRFLNIAESDWVMLIDKPKHELKYKSFIKSETKNWLEEYFKEHNNKLYQLINRDFGW